MGTSGPALIVAGGVQRPDPLSTVDTATVFSDSIQVLLKGNSTWTLVDEKLPRPMAYGVSISHDQGLVCLGGENGQQSFRDVFRLKWIDGKLHQDDLPPLPKPCSHACGALLGDYLYVAGGRTTPQATTSLHTFWALDVSQPCEKMKWKPLQPWPGPQRHSAISAVQAGSFFLFGGQQKGSYQSSATPRGLITLGDTYQYTPGKSNIASGIWRQRENMPPATTGNVLPTFPLGESHIALMGGRENMTENFEPKDHSPLQRSIYLYHTTTDTWSRRGQLPEGSQRVTTPTTHWNDGWAILTQQGSSSHASWQAHLVSPQSRSGRFQTMDWVALSVYLLVLIGIASYFAKREHNTHEYFLGGRRVPWWAAGLSIFGTQLSAMTFMATPAVTFAEDWVRIIPVLMYAPAGLLTIHFFLPFYRRLNVTTAYEYLERRFNTSVQMLGSGVFIISQLLRVAVVVYLPALALAAATGLNVHLCIVAMGVLCITYTVLGGIEAVIWTDVIQVVVLIMGAVCCLIIIIVDAGGLTNTVQSAAADNKFHAFDWNWDITEMCVWVMMFGGFFSIFGQFTGEQTTVQRYMTTHDEKAAMRGIWTTCILSLVTAPIFSGLGTALYVFYKNHPELLVPGRNDAIVPWFIVEQLPAGIAGLVIAGIFAAAMSSLDSAMHSAATAYVTDFHQRWQPSMSDSRGLNLARWITVFVGVLGTGMAMLLTEVQHLPIVDLWALMLGRIIGGVYGIFLLAAFTRRATAGGAIVGMVVGTLAPYLVSRLINVHFYLYTSIGMISCVAVGYLASLVLPGGTKDLTGLTIFHKPDNR